MFFLLWLWGWQKLDLELIEWRSNVSDWIASALTLLCCPIIHNFPFLSTPTTFLTVNINWLLPVWCKAQSWVAHNVTHLKYKYVKSDWRVTSQKPHEKHIWSNKHLHHGDGAVNPSGDVVLTYPRWPRGRLLPFGYFFRGPCQMVLMDSLNYCRILLYLCWPLCFIEIGLTCRQQWWPKQRPLSLSTANNIKKTNSTY